MFEWLQLERPPLLANLRPKWTIFEPQAAVVVVVSLLLSVWHCSKFEAAASFTCKMGFRNGVLFPLSSEQASDIWLSMKQVREAH